MRKNILILAVLSLSVGAFDLAAQSYVDNDFQRLARQYTEQTQEAYETGEYGLSIEYAAKAEENAELSRAYIQKMILKAEAGRKIRHARRRIAWAESEDAPTRFPDLFAEAAYCFESAQEYYDGEDYTAAIDYGQLAIDILSGITPAPKLPQYYVVRPWPDSGDCLWNIAKFPFVYNDPYQWRTLFEANKDNMPDPKNPNLIHPGMRLLIPSIAGEIREGDYDPSLDYDTFSP